MFIGLGLFGATSDRRIRAKKEKHGDASPEVRLEGLIPAAVCIPIGLFWYGWSAEKQIHWIMPIIGTGWVGLGLIGIFVRPAYSTDYLLVTNVVSRWQFRLT